MLMSREEQNNPLIIFCFEWKEAFQMNIIQQLTVMMKAKAFLVSLLLISIAVSQTASNCNNTLMPLLATGAIQLNPNDIDTSSANKVYYQDLSVAQFNTVDRLGYAFAIAGFQGACSQAYYTLAVDVVEFQNQNTRMRLTINFRSNNGTTLTRWTQVSLTYIVVSRNFDGTYSNIWAGSAQTYLTGDVSNQPIDLISTDYTAAAGTNNDCEMFIDPTLTLNLGPGAGICAGGNKVTTKFAGGDPIIHAYIMGFQFNPSKSTLQTLAAGVFSGLNPTTTSDSAIPVAGPPNKGWAITHAGATVNGPQVTLNSYTGALEWVKIGFVFSRLDSNAGNYPSGSDPLFMQYSSSYVFTKVSSFNVAVPISKGTTLGTDYNLNYFVLPDAKYAIYGLTSFELPIVSSAACTSIYISSTLNNINTYTVATSNTAPVIFFSADIFVKNVDKLCASTTATVPTSTERNTLGKQSFFTVPTQSHDQFILVDNTGTYAAALPATTLTKALIMTNVANPNGNNDTITFRSEIPYINLPLGPTKFVFKFFQGTTGDFPAGVTFNFLVQINGFTVYQKVYVSDLTATLPQLFLPTNNINKGLNLNSATANVVITISFQRQLLNPVIVTTFIDVITYLYAYDPVTGCCVTSCPAQTGLSVQIAPPTCVYCNTQAGLFYNPANGTCTCLSGYYLDSTKTFQCYPCAALYCSTCNAANSAQCTVCVQGAVLDNITQTCSCGGGYFVNGTKCQACSIPCLNCTSPNGACSICSDPINRDITKNCACVNGYYDSGATLCALCSATCYTCNNSQNCLTCDATKFRNLTGGSICTCMNGYYELYYANLTRVCQKCSPECLTCAASPSSCNSCDPSKNRVSGIDNNGHTTCLCLPGFYATPDGSCVQSDCNADPYCSQCEQGLKLCIQCLASKFRILLLPDSKCVCFDGYYEDPITKNCVPCSSGCGICNSSSICTSCVTLATSNNDGTCTCPSQTYFTISVDGVRYCSNCGPHCQICVNDTTCTTCLSSYTKTADNQCVCSIKNYVDSAGNCVPCGTGCLTCKSNAVCTKCVDPLVLQGSSCQATCSDGFTQSGSVCIGCSAGCLQCTANFICYYCANGQYLYNGNCYGVCPAGTIGDNSTGNWKCLPCNSPCKTCVNHPSYCTSCEPGKGYLQTSAVLQSCVLTCVDGTFPLNGVCQVCDFKCATCLGSAVNCISCPAGQLLYKGGCWGVCPAILVNDNSNCVGGCCVDSCPDGFFKIGQSVCSPCAPQCKTCDGRVDNCTSCLQGAVATNGTCVTTCGENQFSFRGFCLACSASCYGCTFNPQNCIQCADGYVLSGSICMRGCQTTQYYDNNLQRCVNCDQSCASCSSTSYCLSCSNTAITPRGGVCSKCPYPCSNCDANGVCTSCLSGFYFFNSQCQSACPAGSYPSNGVCACSSGIVSNGQCVTACSPGYAPINGVCQPCNSNCAQCSGTINTCTQCISGFSLDASTRKCVSVNNCPYGTDLSNGVCTRICDPNFYFYQGICIFGGCFNNYIDNGSGGCLRSSASTASSSSACTANQYNLAGACVANCGSGFYPDSNSGNCINCADNCASCFSANYCVSCQSGFNNVQGSCMQGSSCSSNQVQYGSSCVASCPAGTYLGTNNQCSRSCPDNTYYFSLICYSNCPSSLRTADACVNSCPSGTTNNNGVCA